MRTEDALAQLSVAIKEEQDKRDILLMNSVFFPTTLKVLQFQRCPPQRFYDPLQLLATLPALLILVVLQEPGGRYLTKSLRGSTTIAREYPVSFGCLVSVAPGKPQYPTLYVR